MKDLGSLFGLVLGSFPQSLGELFHRFSGVRAGLSTRRGSCKCLVSAGAGLPTQRVSEGPLVV